MKYNKNLNIYLLCTVACFILGAIFVLVFFRQYIQHPNKEISNVKIQINKNNVLDPNGKWAINVPDGFYLSTPIHWVDVGTGNKESMRFYITENGHDTSTPVYTSAILVIPHYKNVKVNDFYNSSYFTTDPSNPTKLENKKISNPHLRVLISASFV